MGFIVVVVVVAVVAAGVILFDFLDFNRIINHA
jgi:preprotein translocase subunit SecE